MIDDEAADRLATGILAQAVKDYIDAIVRNDTLMQTECETFFMNRKRTLANCGIYYKKAKLRDKHVTFVADWFDVLSNCMDGQAVIDKCQKRAAKLMEEADCDQPLVFEEGVKKAPFPCPFCGGEMMRTCAVRENRQGRKFVTHTCSECKYKINLEFGTLNEPRHACRRCEHYGDQCHCDKHDKTVRDTFTCHDFKERNCKMNYLGKNEEFTLDAEGQAKLEDWIKHCLKKANMINTTKTSYGLKHAAERDLGFYVANCDMKRAMVRCGFIVYVDAEIEPNWMFNITNEVLPYAKSVTRGR